MVDSENDESFLSRHEMKRKPVFHELMRETGHPEHAINSISEKLEDMGFKIETSNSNISEDGLGEGVKNYFQNIEAIRTEKQHRKNSKLFKKISWIALSIAILFTLISLANVYLLVLAIPSWAVFALFFYLSRPLEKKDSVWIKAEAKVYSGTKSRESRNNSKDKSGESRAASTAFFHSEIKFMISGDSEIDVKRVREDISLVSKFIQKI
jgi:hypothetical protein